MKLKFKVRVASKTTLRAMSPETPLASFWTCLMFDFRLIDYESADSHHSVVNSRFESLQVIVEAEFPF